MFTIFSADVIGVPANCRYPNKIEVNDRESLIKAVSHDYVCAEYVNNYRSNESFIGSNCLPVDCDNDHSEFPLDWVSVEDVKLAFPDISFAVHYSRSHMREKNGKAPRPKFHILFPIEYTTDANAYREMKRMVNSIFPYFDTNALDSARFFFGTTEPEVDFYEGSMTLTEYLLGDAFDIDLDRNTSRVITEGTRNATMSRFAGRVMKKYGDGEAAYQAFLEEAEKCVPPLDESELMLIWRSAKKFYSKVQQQGDYVSPEVYNDENSYKPEDYSDVGQAEVLTKYFSKELRYSPATHFLRYNRNYWQETEPGAQAVAQELTRRQLKEATAELVVALKNLEATGAKDILDNTSKAKALMLMNPKQLEAYNAYLDAKAYQSFVVKRRESKNITSTLKETHPMLEISPHELDANAFLLCTPRATYDLRLGLEGAREHSPDDFITKITMVSPGEKGKKLWHDCLDLIFCKDQELIEYVQMVCGLVAIGKVFIEALIIAYGVGRNGKSTFWNTISHVLGLYSGNISADTLTYGCRRNVKPELAETKGKRLLIASEMREGSRLNDSIVKQLCSTDDIFAEKKYRDPFSFVPCHTLVLYTNHLPRVSANDDGTWRRLIVIPFNAKIEGESDIKNYGEYLCINAGESVLAWVIEGAKKAIDFKYRIPVPACVQKAIAEYRNQNDWFGNFLLEKCEVGSTLREPSAQVYKAYRNHCIECSEYIRSTADFYSTLENAGFERVVLDRRSYVKGLKLKDEEFLA